MYRKHCPKETPLYTGKADPKIAHAENPTEQGESLSRRINEHRKSIELVSGEGGISLDDFEVRYLVTASGFQVTAENFLINYFKPIWNKETKICFGIGKHGDDANTRKNKKSPCHWHLGHRAVILQASKPASYPSDIRSMRNAPKTY
ncbi:Eco29kI family restriction endonuclease [Paracoccus sp. Z330]|uniref:Eco29kI family restriction endonuclease n=1 Tax=Paracoccus onchidii TaxID=3017813 RepID=A0ABT4ZFI1_9RHOB|nr:Eco29kI family restriction endonuclease [Paracoccus onchidii]MDB6177481.1 Eco29kI family restriction endonuclease [Paracoccus onchidii]